MAERGNAEVGDELGRRGEADDLIDADQDGAQAAPVVPQAERGSELREMLAIFNVRAGREGMVVDSAGEEDAGEVRTPLETQIDDIYEDIQKLAMVLADPNNEWTEGHLTALYNTATAVSETLTSKKRKQKTEDKQGFKADSRRYNGHFFTLDNSIILINKKRIALKKRTQEMEKERHRREAIARARRDVEVAEAEEEARVAEAALLAEGGDAADLAAVPRLGPRRRREERDIFTDRILEDMTDMRLRILELEAERRDIPPPERSYGMGRGRTRDAGEYNHPRIKAITCPNFKGDYPKFCSFRTTFENLYGREDMSTIDLAMRLYEHLEGDAKKKVENLYQHNLDRFCYTKMWHELEKVYGGEEVLTSEMITMAVMMKPFRVLEPREIEDFYDSFRTQFEYWQRTGPAGLRDPLDFKYNLLRLKLGPKLNVDYADFCNERRYKPNMLALWRWTDEIYQKFIVTTKESENRTKIQRIHLDSTKPLRRPGWDKPQKIVPLRQEIKVTNVEEPDEDDDMEYDSSQETLLEGDSDEEVVITKAQLRNFGRKPPLTKKEGCQDCVNLKHKPQDCDAFKKLTAVQRSIFIRNSGLCFHCLVEKHLVRDCKVKEGEKCGIDGCDRYHHQLLHSIKTAHAIMHAQYPEVEEEEELLMGTSYNTEKGRSNMQTLVAYLEGTAEPKQVICMLDSGANVSCIDEELAKELGAQVLSHKGKQIIKYLDRKVPVNTQLVRILITDLSKEARFTMDAWTIPNLNKGTRAVDWSEEKKNWPHLENIDFPKLPDDKRINFLIGNTYSDFFVPLEVARGPEYMQPLGVKTPFGWTVLGGTKRKSGLLDALKGAGIIDKQCWKAVFSRAVRILKGN